MNQKDAGPIDDVILVFAGTLDEAKHFLGGLKSLVIGRFKYISSANALRGYESGTKYIRVGTWELRRDPEKIDIETVLMTKGFVKARPYELQDCLAGSKKLNQRQLQLWKPSPGGNVVTILSPSSSLDEDLEEESSCSNTTSHSKSTSKTCLNEIEKEMYKHRARKTKVI